MQTDENGWNYYSNLDEAKKDGYAPVKVISLLQFFTLPGRRSVMSKENLEPIPDLKYCVYSPAEDKYYIRDYRNYDIDTLFFYRRSDTFSGEDTAVESLRRYIEDGNVWILFTKEQVSDTTAMLEKLWKSQLSGEGKLDYRIYLNLLDQSLRLEDYQGYAKNLTGYKTVCKQFTDRIAELWREAYNKH